MRAFPDEFRVVGLAARRSFASLRSQIKEFHPKYVSFEGTDEERAAFTSNGRVICSMEEMVAFPDVDLVVSATVGDAALGPTIAAIEAGKEIVLVNKEAIIMAGPILMDLARKHGVELRPADSEPNAIWQCIRGEDKTVSKLIITASGGAFRDYDIDMLDQVTPAQALEHPTWDMGPKITVDSATLMNKALEVIEARWLFDMDWDDIEVVIHPQSLIHSMVEFVDGSVKAQISPPDMRLPLQYSMLYPKRAPNAAIQRVRPRRGGRADLQTLGPQPVPMLPAGDRRRQAGRHVARRPQRRGRDGRRDILGRTHQVHRYPGRDRTSAPGIHIRRRPHDRRHHRSVHVGQAARRADSGDVDV